MSHTRRPYSQLTLKVGPLDENNILLLTKARHSTYGRVSDKKRVIKKTQRKCVGTRVLVCKSYNLFVDPVNKISESKY